uniref:SRCR domain-containing protein n=1 Tax=Sciurus vulgaris TaxID=55149 RepID=A0A8D2AKL8_SCIVU
TQIDTHLMLRMICPYKRTHMHTYKCLLSSIGFVHLDGGGGPCSGRVEVNSGGGWTPVSDGNFTLATAQVICAELGYGKAASVLGNLPFREPGEKVWAEEFQCKGQEPGLWFCPRVPCPGGSCHHRGAVQVVCSGETQQDFNLHEHSVEITKCGMLLKSCLLPEYTDTSRELRLVDGGGRCVGRVEILQQGSWGSICDDSWDLSDAHVVCRQLGCGVALEATFSAHFGEGSGPIWLNELNCTGEEAHVWQCPSQGWGQHNCRHKEDAGVICSEFLALRMVSEDQECAGWLEVFYNNTWGSVCHSPMEAVTLSVICRHLGCGDSSRPRWVDNIRCRKTDTSLWQCPSDPWKQRSCSPKEEAYIMCSGKRPQSCPTTAPCTDREKLRLRGGDSRCSGRVEVWHEGSWGTVCDDSWSLAEAEVVCQQLGCGSALEAPGEAAFGPGNGSIWLDEVQCRGREPSLWACAAAAWGQSDCKHEEDAGVRSSTPIPGIFPLPGILCMILGTLLFLVLIILGTQLLRRRSECQALSTFEDAVDKGLYQEIDYPTNPEKENLLDSPGSLSDGSATKLPYYTVDDEENGDPESAPGSRNRTFEPEHLKIFMVKENIGNYSFDPEIEGYATGNGYDDVEELPVSEIPSSSGLKENFFPEEGGGARYSQTGISSQSLREADSSNMEEIASSLVLKQEDPGCDDIEPNTM